MLIMMMLGIRLDWGINIKREERKKDLIVMSIWGVCVCVLCVLFELEVGSWKPKSHGAA
jgi:predicted permease